jgi:DNA processing protein
LIWVALEKMVSQLPSTHTDHSLSSPSQPLLDWLSLLFLPGVGCTLVNRLVHTFGSPGFVLSAKPTQLLEVEGIGRKMASLITDPVQVQASKNRAVQELRNVAEGNCSVVCPVDESYPANLLNIADPPVALFCRGDMACLEKPTVAIVGSRAATTYGKRVSFELARELARHGICVVSGMAMGVDGEAHAGALAGGGATIGVLGCGVDVVYPHQHASLFKEVAGRGLLMSEYPLGTTPDGFRFPERNRIISGVSLGTVVVEASLKSGSLITARLALDYGRDVFAVPGRIDSPKSQGTHRLLQQGAKLVSCVDDILEELDMAGLLNHGHVKGNNTTQAVELKKEEKHLLSCLEVYPATIDELVVESGYTGAAIFQILLSLELKGLVRQLPGQQYELRQ